MKRTGWYRGKLLAASWLAEHPRARVKRQQDLRCVCVCILVCACVCEREIERECVYRSVRVCGRASVWMGSGGDDVCG